MDSKTKRKRKAYILSANPNKKRRSEATLSPGMRGFICTCNGNEKGCIREALNILDEYDSKLNSLVNLPPGTEVEGNDSDDDIEKKLKEEIGMEKQHDKKFKVIDTGMNNCIFISSKALNVVEMAEKIMKDAKDAASSKSRFLIRMVPVQVTCKAYNDDIKKAAESILDAHFTAEPVSYCININKRSNNNLLRMEVTDDLARLVRDRNKDHVVDLKNPAKTIIVEIIRNICCLSVVNTFFEFRKFNLVMLGNSKDITGKSNYLTGEANSNILDCHSNESVTEKNVEKCDVEEKAKQKDNRDASNGLVGALNVKQNPEKPQTPEDEKLEIDQGSNLIKCGTSPVNVQED